MLLPDFGGDRESLAVAVSGGPSLAAHNVETVPRLYPSLRPGADYARSLAVLRRLSGMGLRVRSSLMVGLGETRSELSRVFADLRSAGVDELVVGQYLPPSSRHVRVAEFMGPDAFDDYAREGYTLGFHTVLAAPLARSSMELHRG